jgi:hypothetical protein
VVCLQELWIYKDFEIVREEVLQNLPFSRFFHTWVAPPLVLLLQRRDRRDRRVIVALWPELYQSHCAVTTLRCTLTLSVAHSARDSPSSLDTR